MFYRRSDNYLLIIDLANFHDGCGDHCLFAIICLSFVFISPISLWHVTAAPDEVAIDSFYFRFTL